MIASSDNSLESALAAFPATPTLADPVPIQQFLKMDVPKREMLLSPWLPEKGLAMIAGPRGLGKTFLALNVACTIAGGGTFLGWAANHPRSVLYVDGEMPAITLQQRLNGIATSALLSSGNLSLLAADLSECGLPDLSTLEGQAWLRPKLDPFDVILLDNLSTLCRTGRENEAESWAVIQTFLLELRRAGKSVVFIHHTGKAGGQRGTSAKEDVLDSVLLLKRPGEYEPSQGLRCIIQFDKARGFSGDAAQSFEASLDRQTGQWTRKTDTREANILKLSEDGLSVREIEKQLKVSKSTVNRTLQRARGSGQTS